MQHCLVFHVVTRGACRLEAEGETPLRSGWILALRDPRIGRAIALIHRDPAHAWTVASLAKAVAMSRSAFAARFAEVVGVPPMQHVVQWRMQVAMTLL